MESLVTSHLAWLFFIVIIIKAYKEVKIKKMACKKMAVDH